MKMMQTRQCAFMRSACSGPAPTVTAKGPSRRARSSIANNAVAKIDEAVTATSRPTCRAWTARKPRPAHASLNLRFLRPSHSPSTALHATAALALAPSGILIPLIHVLAQQPQYGVVALGIAAASGLVGGIVAHKGNTLARHTMSIKAASLTAEHAAKMSEIRANMSMQQAAHDELVHAHETRARHLQIAAQGHQHAEFNLSAKLRAAQDGEVFDSLRDDWATKRPSGKVSAADPGLARAVQQRVRQPMYRQLQVEAVHLEQMRGYLEAAACNLYLQSE